MLMQLQLQHLALCELELKLHAVEPRVVFVEFETGWWRNIYFFGAPPPKSS